ncbi:MAG: thermonuclease family protein [Planctomycetota bacterium]|jgi:micrococcal nuclease
MKRLTRRQRRAVAVVVAMTAAAAVVVARSRARSRGKWFVARGKVRRVSDGDSFTLANGERVRLLEIDAPEIAGEQGELAQQSLAALVELIGGRVVRLEPGPRMRDRYDRMLAYVFVEGEPGAADVFVNAEVVHAGLARAKTWGKPGRRWDDILAAESEARDAERGMWAAPGP